MHRFLALPAVLAACASQTRSAPPGFAALAGTSTTSLAAIAPDTCPRTTHAFEQPIAIVEDSSERWPPIASFPIAFPREAELRSLAGFYVTTREGRPLPAQLEVLSRWSDAPNECGAPIRWAYAWVLGANAGPGREYLVLRHDPAHTIAMNPRLEIDASADQIVVDTKRARFEITKSGLEVAGAAKADLAADSLELERSGPHVATVVLRGRYAKPLRFVTRLHFYAGTAAVAIDHTYYNGELKDDTARGGKIRTLVDHVAMRFSLPNTRETRALAVEQPKRSPERPDFAPREGVLAIDGVSAAIAFLGDRDPQAIRYDPKTRTLELAFQSEPMWIGGGRGIWTKAILDFDAHEPKALLAHVERPLIGVPSLAYLDTTRAYGTLPTGELDDRYARFDRDVDRIHTRTRDFLRAVPITGLQIWPDLPRTAAIAPGYFEGGDDNYWDWSLVELEQFLRTADPAFIHDFALSEAITMAETISFRPDPGTPSSFAGFSPCYGGARDDEKNEWHEGLNHRMGTCPGDYSYNKVHRLAYLLTADRRFLDFFADGAETAIRMYKDPPRTKPDEWLELSASRTTYQYLEPLLDAAEFMRDPKLSRRYRDRAISYFDHLTTNALERGHTCNLLGSGTDDPKQRGDCTSDQAWMLPVWIEWVARLAELYEHAPAKIWIRDFAKMSAKRHTVLDARGLPELDAERSNEGWRTVYRCPASPNGGIRDDACEKITKLENDAYFYPNGLLAYLNAFGIALDADPSDSNRICAWLPEAYEAALARMDQQTNRYIWGKELGQAYAMAQRALGAIEAHCKHER